MTEDLDNHGPRFREEYAVYTREDVSDVWWAVDVLDSYSHGMDFDDDGGYREIEETRVLEQHAATGEYRVNVIKAVEKHD